MESALQVQLAQNSLQAAKQKQAPTRPSVDRLNIEERIAAVSCSLVGITLLLASHNFGITLLLVSHNFGMLERTKILLVRHVRSWCLSITLTSPLVRLIGCVSVDQAELRHRTKLRRDA